MRGVATIDPALSRYRDAVARMGAGAARAAMSSALAVGGEDARAQAAAAEARQTNLQPQVLDRALQGEMVGDLAYVVLSRGGNVRLKYFSPVEGGGGVTASPWGKATRYAGAFITSGRVGARRASPKLNGHVYQRVDPANKRWGAKIRQSRSGLYIPTEMVKGATLAAFQRASARIGDIALTRIASMLP